MSFKSFSNSQDDDIEIGSGWDTIKKNYDFIENDKPKDALDLNDNKKFWNRDSNLIVQIHSFASLAEN